MGKAEFSGRTPSKIQLLHRYMNGVPQGIIMTEDSQWATQRRFSLKTLKDFGFGKKSIEDSIHFEADEIAESFLLQQGDTLMGTDFNAPIINILWQMVADSRFSADDPEGMKMVDNVTKIFTTGIKIQLIPIFICKMFPGWTRYNERKNAHKVIFDYLRNIIGKHEETLDVHNPRDFIDVYLTELQNEKVSGKYTKEDLIGCIYDFFVAGTETSSTTLKWAVLYLTLHQDVQERCYEEISTVLGSRKANVSDMPSLPYVQATIAEIQRVA